MRIIAHRGNTNGPSHSSVENSPSTIDTALNQGFDAEVDLWIDSKTNELWLGHDNPQFKVDKTWLYERSSGLWVHLKSLSTAESLLFLHCHDGLDEMLNWFWHETDKFTLTSKGVVWCYPEVFVRGGVVNQPSNDSVFWSTEFYKQLRPYGLCTDWCHEAKQRIASMNK